MSDTIYLDNSATTAICEAAKNKITEMLSLYGNPSSLHAVGFEAAKELRAARSTILSTLGVRAIKDEHFRRLVFTSCGTEATSLAIFGSAHAKERREASRIITTDSEHPATENALCALEKEGFEIIRLSTRGGILDMKELDKALERPVFMATLMLVNNETGALYNVSEVFRKVKAKYPSALTHCDAVQGYLKVKFTPEAIGADLVSISAHKIHGPKGVGALYISPNVLKERRLVPFLLGGGQENGLRSGTENTLGIAGFGAAAAECFAQMPTYIPRMRALREYAIKALSELDLKINAPLGEVAPHVINISLPNIKSQTMLNFLSAKRIYVSSGSACSSRANKTSKTLLAFGLTENEADCALRISLSKYSTEAEIDALASALAEGIATLVKINKK